MLLAHWLTNFDDVCNSSSAITGLKMPDYVVMSTQTITQFHTANPSMRLILTLREPVARTFSYFAMQARALSPAVPARVLIIDVVLVMSQLRLGWSPINHMGKNPCMQQQLRALVRSKEEQRRSTAFTVEVRRAAFAARLRGDD
jgi:hypothetical protein